MKHIELQEAFEIELNVLDDAFNKPKSMDTEWWLNRGLEKFFKTRYSGVNYKELGFEQNQKLIDDSRTMVKQESIVVKKESSELYTVQLPSDYIFHLGDTVGIQPADGYNDKCWPLDSKGDYIVKYTDTLESSVETIDRQKANSLSEHKLKYCTARPLRLIQGDKVILYTDGKYKVSEYKLTYLRKPQQIDIHSNPFAEYIDMPEHTHFEIVKIAAQMYIENQSNQRVNTHNDEVDTME